jgi:hypothetical protein
LNSRLKGIWGTTPLLTTSLCSKNNSGFITLSSVLVENVLFKVEQTVELA